MGDIRRYLIFGLISIALLSSAMQFFMVFVGLPELIRDIDAPIRWASWIITGFSLASAVSTPLSGKLSDDIGRRTMFIIGLVGFALSSLVCALAPNIYVLIAGRIVQGVTGGGLMPSAIGIIASEFPQQRVKAVGLASVMFPTGALIGPNLGGFIVDNYGWRWTFAVNVPVGLLVAVGAWFLVTNVKAQRDPQSSGSKLDLKGAGLLTVTVGGLVYALTELAQTTADPNLIIVGVSLALFAVGLVLLLQHESRTPDPVVDLSLFRSVQFSSMQALMFMYGGLLTATTAYLPLYAQAAYAMDSGETGYLLTPRALTIMGTSALTTMVLARIGYRKPMVVGFIIFGVAVLLLSRGIHTPSILGIEFSNFVYLAGVIALSGLGIGMLNPTVFNAGLELAPDRIATVMGLRGMFQSIGGSVAASALALIISRADSTEQGLESSFLLVAVLSFLTPLLVFGVPSRYVATPQATPVSPSEVREPSAPT